MLISFDPMRNYMKNHGVSYYFLATNGIDAKTLQRIRHDQPITTTTLAKICKILNCQPDQLIKYIAELETIE